MQRPFLNSGYFASTCTVKKTDGTSIYSGNVFDLIAVQGDRVVAQTDPSSYAWEDFSRRSSELNSPVLYRVTVFSGDVVNIKSLNNCTISPYCPTQFRRIDRGSLVALTEAVSSD